MEDGVYHEKTVALMPSRLLCWRSYPGKALLDIYGYPIIVHLQRELMLSKLI